MFNWVDSKTVNGWCGMSLVVEIVLSWVAAGIGSWSWYFIALAIFNTAISLPVIHGFKSYLNSVLSGTVFIVDLIVSIILFCIFGYTVSSLLLIVAGCLALFVCILDLFTR